jgi:hypothetical protein
VQQDDGITAADVYITDLRVEHLRTASLMGVGGVNDHIGQGALHIVAIDTT